MMWEMDAIAIPMLNQRNILTALGCSGSLALALSVTQPAVASQPTEHTVEDGLTNLVQADSNPITDALTCSCARCLWGQQQTSM
ncbi:hypothetical protein D0962_09640 [Leptolyngbyaceae cyanobacterium CCMR0082]|uniref:Uncharacterized protein n=2 Tax=Adonisia turfae TaxID=2950184 RepID=A0A6M0S3E2_9CYAN|nr:hypothetical protein [Adonisia turfae]MDV3351691.1 hypothetical protein [Leptothoe sp. LEGE 181152]NEZ56316.1 hypothetical protein [Adonisia turfae CCMR0081]NEZ63039.1 hypothetical protein [Adonisia turfae CCMR0082]